MSVTAVNAVALYLSLVHIIADLRETEQAQPRPSFMTLWAAGLSLMIGIVPAPFVSTATDAHDVIARPSLGAHHGRETTRIEPRQQEPSA